MMKPLHVSTSSEAEVQNDGTLHTQHSQSYIMWSDLLQSYQCIVYSTQCRKSNVCFTLLLHFIYNLLEA